MGRWGIGAGQRAQLSVERHPLVEDEAVAAKMRAAGLLEIPQDAAVELVHLAAAQFTQQRRRLLAANAAGAESDHRPVTDAVAQLAAAPARPVGEIAEACVAEVARGSKGAGLEFEPIARVEQDEIAALIEPPPQLARRDPGSPARPEEHT